jgi:hypothetical protein
MQNEKEKKIIVQPLAIPNTQKELQKNSSIFWAFISKSLFSQKKGVAHGVYLPAAVKGLTELIIGIHVYCKETMLASCS